MKRRAFLGLPLIAVVPVASAMKSIELTGERIPASGEGWTTYEFKYEFPEYAAFLRSDSWVQVAVGGEKFYMPIFKGWKK